MAPAHRELYTGLGVHTGIAYRVAPNLTPAFTALRTVGIGS